MSGLRDRLHNVLFESEPAERPAATVAPTIATASAGAAAPPAALAPDAAAVETLRHAVLEGESAYVKFCRVRDAMPAGTPESAALAACAALGVDRAGIQSALTAHLGHLDVEKAHFDQAAKDREHATLGNQADLDALAQKIAADQAKAEALTRTIAEATAALAAGAARFQAAYTAVQRQLQDDQGRLAPAQGA